MRRIVFLSLIAVVSLLSFSGCDKENQAKGPKIETLSAEKGSYFVVSLSGRVSGLEGIALDFECGIEYSTDASFPEDKTTRQKVDKKYSEEPFTITLTRVSPDQKYYFRAYYVSQSMIYYGEIKDFIFSWDAPQITTLSAELSEMDGTVIYVCKGLISDLGDFVKYYTSNLDLGLHYGIQYSKSENFEVFLTQTAHLYSYNNEMGDTIVCSISDFNYNTQYYYRAFFSFGSISVKGDTKSFKYDFTPKENGTENGYQYIDLGLSVKWAPFNLGATKPEEYGDYYAWGDTEPYYEIGYAQENPQAHWKEGKLGGYDWTNYKWCNGSYNKQIKYNNNSSYGTVDNKNTLELEDDVANVAWGGSWRMPTQHELYELWSNSIWTTTTLNGIVMASLILEHGL